jgi:peptidoglycan/xylan/chitin deacetylase (PgdA/CDA1 family)
VDLKLNTVQATLTRAGTAVLMLVLLCTVLVVADTVLSSSPASPVQVDSGYPVVLPDPNTRDVPRGLSQGFIPLGRTRITVPILMYHYIRTVPKYPDLLGWNLSVTPADFNQQLNWLSVHGYHSVTFDDLRAYFSGARALPSKPVVITLDDGYRDLYTTAYPMIKAHGFVAVAYIVTGFVGRLRYVTSDMILQMDHDGFEIASHTVDHANMAHLALGSIFYELVASKQWLERLLGHPVVDFAYPSGKFNALDVTELGVTGYSTAVAEDGPTYRTWATRFGWTRTRVAGGEAFVDFVKNLGPVEPYVFAPANVV